MLELINNVAPNVVAAKASGDVSKGEYESVLMPALDAQAEKGNDVNLLMFVDTEVGNFSIGAWWDDVKAGLKNIAHWHKTAIVTDQKGVRTFTEAFGKIFPGECKGFATAELDEAKTWVSS